MQSAGVTAVPTPQRLPGDSRTRLWTAFLLVNAELQAGFVSEVQENSAALEHPTADMPRKYPGAVQAAPEV